MDARNQLFHVVSPLSLPELSQVNTLLRGALDVPDWLLLNQVSSCSVRSATAQSGQQLLNQVIRAFDEVTLSACSKWPMVTRRTWAAR